MRKKIFVTGGNGYVGRDLVRMLYRDHDVCVADIVRYGQIRFHPSELRSFRFEHADIRKEEAIASLLSEFQPDTIIHLAAIHYIPECEQNSDLAVSTNVGGTVNVLNAAPPAARVIFASSGAVYRPDDSPHNEATAALEPSDVYGLTKLHGEQYVRYFARKNNLATVVVRLFNVVGPGETNAHLLPEIVAQLKAGRRTIRLGNMWPKRDYIHVQDAARGFATIALAQDVSPGNTVTVNLGTSRAYSVSEVVSKLRHASHIDFALEEEQSRLRKVDRPYLAADIGEIGRLFGWRPQHTIDDALRDMWRNPELTTELMAKYQ